MALLSKTARGVQDDKETCKKLLIQFLKMHHLMHYIYNYERKAIIPTKGKISLRFADAFIDRTIDQILPMYDLQMSQLWRFYLLEHLDLFKPSNQAFLEMDIRSCLANNGTRKSKELEELFKKHGIIPKKTQ